MNPVLAARPPIRSRQRAWRTYRSRCLGWLVVSAIATAGLQAPAADGPIDQVRRSRPLARTNRVPRDHRSFDAIGSEYAREIRPLMTQFCLNCHSTAKQKGDLDLERFSRLEDVRRETKVWLKVAEMLDNGEMPPEESKQPSAAQRKTAARMGRAVSPGRGFGERG